MPGEKTDTQKQTQNLDPKVEEYRDWVYQQAQALPEQWSPYGGQTVAGPSQGTMQGFQTLQNFDPRVSGGYGSLASNLGFANQQMRDLSGQSFDQADLSGYMNPYQQQVISQVQSDYDRALARGIRGQGDEAIRQGAFGGGRHGIAEASLASQLAREEAGTLAGVRHSGYESAAGKWADDQTRRFGMSQNLANLGLSGAQGLSGMQQQRGMAQIGAGEYGRGIEQQQLASDYQQWQQQQMYPMQRLQSLYGGYGAPSGSETTTKMTIPGDPWGDVTGLIAALAGGLGKVV